MEIKPVTFKLEYKFGGDSYTIYTDGKKRLFYPSGLDENPPKMEDIRALAEDKSSSGGLVFRKKIDCYIVVMLVKKDGWVYLTDGFYKQDFYAGSGERPGKLDVQELVREIENPGEGTDVAETYAPFFEFRKIIENHPLSELVVLDLVEQCSPGLIEKFKQGSEG